VRYGLLQLISVGQRVTQIAPDTGVTFLDRQCPVITGDGVLQQAFLPVGDTEVAPYPRIDGIDFKAFSVGSDRIIQIVFAMQGVGLLSKC